MCEDRLAKFLDDQFKFHEKNEKLIKENIALKEDLARSNAVIKAQKEAMEINYELRWALKMKNNELESDNWNKNK